MTIVSAMGQIFYSLSIAMGILITFGSYMKKEVSIKGSKENVEIFDTAILIMAGLMIILAVFSFSGEDMEILKCVQSVALKIEKADPKLEREENERLKKLIDEKFTKRVEI